MFFFFVPIPVLLASLVANFFFMHHEWFSSKCRLIHSNNNIVLFLFLFQYKFGTRTFDIPRCFYACNSVMGMSANFVMCVAMSGTVRKNPHPNKFKWRVWIGRLEVNVVIIMNMISSWLRTWKLKEGEGYGVIISNALT